MDDRFEDVPHGSQEHYPNYNLFQSSVFYDTNNFREAYLSLRYDDSGTEKKSPGRQETGEKSPGASEEPSDEVSEPRVDSKPYISLQSLLKDPALFRSQLDDLDDFQSPTKTEPPFPSASQPWGYDWTKQSWVKSGDQPGKDTALNKSVRKERGITGKKRKHIYNLVNAPKISLGKAESMMQKMGWQGGALGRGRNGITEPITPNPLYCSSNLGFGQNTKRDKLKSSKPGQTVRKKGLLRTNVLLYIRDFVRDDTEIELHFDQQLHKGHRREIHQLVENIINGGANVNLSDFQRELLNDIHEYNTYELRTVSIGEGSARQITVYKEAPKNVYLVTPDDFIDEDTDEQTNHENIDDTGTDKNDLNDTAVKEKETLEAMEEDENPFLKSIKKSINNYKDITYIIDDDSNIDKEEIVDLTNNTSKDKILEFFLEFADSELYKEFRFLGKFTEEQTSVIDEFLNDVEVCINDIDSFKGNKHILKVFKKNAAYEVKDGCNGTVEIHKLRRPS